MNTTFFYQTLQKKVKKNPSLKPLLTQLDAEIPIIVDLLKHTDWVFRHYSSHKEDHSKNILNNIYDLLGEDKIQSMTSCDIWLLIEAAYCHDIGMCVSFDELKSELKKTHFGKYLDKVKANKYHELNPFVSALTADDISKLLNSPSELIELNNLFYQLLADWFRPFHGYRSETMIKDGKFGACLFYRDQAISPRLFIHLAKICSAHTKTFFDGIISDELPQFEKGLSTEKCHPRFIASLLRLGDLLDLDQGRFSPTTKEMAGEMPPSSEAHVEKHKSVERFYICPTSVELTADCPTDESYVAMADWAKWLEDELYDQYKHWHDIRPNERFSPPPALNPKRIVHIGSDYTPINGELPQLSLDSPNAIEMLQGANIYSSKWDAIRELLQNAVDATLIKIWYDNPADQDVLRKEGPHGQRFKELAKHHEILISLELCEGEQAKITKKIETTEVMCKITVSDQGTGISQNSFKQMISIASSSTNIEKLEQIKDMPEWMRPSGVFGLGLQSVFFLGAEDLHFRSHSFIDHKSFEFIIPNPVGRKNGYIKFKNVDCVIGEKPGTQISFSLKVFCVTTKRPRLLHYNGGNECYYHQLEITELIQEIVLFKYRSYLNITWDIKLPNYLSLRDSYGQALSDPFEVAARYYRRRGIKTTEMCHFFDNVKTNDGFVSFLLSCSYSQDRGFSPDFFFKGQPARASINLNYEEHSSRLPGVEAIEQLVECEFDIVSGSAHDWLHLNRETFIQPALTLLNDTIISSIIDYTKLYLDRIEIEQRPWASLLLFLCGFNDIAGEYWMGCSFKALNSVNIKIKDILKLDSIRIAYVTRDDEDIDRENDHIISHACRDFDMALVDRHPWSKTSTRRSVIKKLLQLNGYVEILENVQLFKSDDYNPFGCYMFSFEYSKNDKIDKIVNQDILSKFLSFPQEDRIGEDLVIVPAFRPFEELSIISSNDLYYLQDAHLCPYGDILYFDKINILPLLIEYNDEVTPQASQIRLLNPDELNSLCLFIHDHLPSDNRLELHEITNLYQQLMEWCRGVIEKIV